MSVFETTYLDGLNAAQRQAVLHKEGPLLILAGAGAGKTKVITHRILNLIVNGVAPEQILAVTFTNKAAKEMSERVKSLFEKTATESGAGMNRPFVSTFHALGVYILREQGRLLGLSRHFTIFDRNDSMQAVKEAMRLEELDPKQIEPKKILSGISRQKGNGRTSREFAQSIGNDYYPGILARVWERYEDILKKENACDFDDLLLKCLKLLEQNEVVRQYYQQKWRYVHIDEYQDTNKVQYAMARYLTGKELNLCVVGDIDQNIYSWRGADIENILSFEKEYPEATVITLEQNYRSTKTILSASNTIIKKNKRRREKNLFTDNEQGEQITVAGLYDEGGEARYIAGKAGTLIEGGTEPRDIAVLYRANFQSRALEEAFITNDIPYQVLGVRFFERKEVKDMLSYIKAALNPQSTSDLKRIINVPTRGIGKVTILKVLEGKEEGLPSAMRQKVFAFKDILKRLGEFALISPASETLKFALRESGLEASLKAGDDEDLERLENLRELVTLAIRYDTLPPEEGIAKLLEEAALASDQDELKEDRNAVKLMTVHASKGLEFDYVFVSGLEEGLFPHKSLSEDRIDDEEERRLFYVALTRARKKVFMTFASTRTIFGSREMNIPSEFITDIDEDLVEAENAAEADNSSRTIIYLD